MKNVFKKLSQLRKDGQLIRALTYKLLTKTGVGPLFSFETQGLRLKMYSTDMTFEAYKNPATYRWYDKIFIEQVIKPGMFVVDIGANIGMIAARSAKIVGDKGRVIAIEPNPKIAPICRQNIELNGLKNVTVFQTALGAKEGTISFNCDRSDDCSRVIESGGVTVPITTLDKVMEVEPTRDIDLLKIDVEGFEMTVLESAPQSLKRTQMIYIEVDAENYSQYGRRTSEVTGLLDASGFDMFVADESGKWSPLKGDVTHSVNVIGVRRKANASANIPSAALASRS